MVGKLASDVGAELNRRGLPTHDVELCQETLGWEFGDARPEVRITARRLWKLRLGTLELLREGWGSGQLVERIVGHFTFAALLRRELLSCFQAVYVFIRRQYRVHCRLWPQVARELRWACSLLPLVQRDLSAKWSSTVHATDASFWGRGVAAAEAPTESIKAQARVQDRWRSSQQEEVNIHNSLNSGAGGHTDILDFELAQAQRECAPVCELEPEFLDRCWKRVESHAWGRPEPIPVLEGRAIVWLVQHLARSQKNHGKRHLIISDSMTTLLALGKGRGNSRSKSRPYPLPVLSSFTTDGLLANSTPQTRPQEEGP